jgi:hypothetical protein
MRKAMDSYSEKTYSAGSYSAGSYSTKKRKGLPGGRKTAS